MPGELEAFSIWVHLAIPTQRIVVSAEMTKHLGKFQFWDSLRDFIREGYFVFLVQVAETQGNTHQGPANFVGLLQTYSHTGHP